MKSEHSEPSKYSLGRRQFIGAAFAGAGLSFVGVKAQAEEGVARVMPASPLAQSALLMFAPEMAVSLVCEPDEAEIPRGWSCAVSLPVTGRFDESNAERFLSVMNDLQPDFLFDVGLYGDEHWRAVADLEKNFGTKVITLDTGGLTVFSAIKTACGLLGCSLQEKKMSALDEMEALMIKGIESVLPDERYTVHMGESSVSVSCFAQKSPEHRMLAEACAYEWQAQNEESMIDGSGPEVVVCMTEEAWKGYLAKNHAQFGWSLTDAAVCGCVLPGLVAGVQWIGKMSPFAKMTIGALWLGNLLYPSSFEFNEGYVASLYYKVLLGKDDAAIEQNREILDCLESFRKKKRVEIIADQQLSRERKNRFAAQIMARIHRVDSRDLSDEERGVLCRFLEGRMPKEDEPSNVPFANTNEEELG